MVRYPPMHLDLNFLSVLCDLFGPMLPGRRDALTLCEVGDVYASVRTAWDAFLLEKAFPAGSEVVFSALTIPHMADIALAHGLVVVAADLDESTGLPSETSLKACLTEKTACVIVAHLFGNWSDVSLLARLCQKAGVYFVEDCAQCYLGRDFQGSHAADISLFSFGTIKRRTALGGAIAVVRNAALRESMWRRTAHFTRQSHTSFLQRLGKASCLKLATWPPFYTLLVWAIRLFWNDTPDVVLRNMVRGFPKASIPGSFRIRPSLFHEWLIRARANGATQKSTLARGSQWEHILTLAPSIARRFAGHKSSIRSAWLLPYLSDTPDETKKELQNHGFDAAHSLTSLAAVAPLQTPNAVRLLSQIVFLSVPKNRSDGGLETHTVLRQLQLLARYENQRALPFEDKAQRELSP
ncbi:MAG: DegT/DnrJ/EryC1/StrS aminotransferase family protein [Silvanigrellales bacterium]|nr:DegT/DnrJ/EryC1/StrS aminotransferase family protein [Silvanigrellales bacterium]